MNPPLAITPLITHIPHAVPVVIVWGIMLRFYLVERRRKVDPARRNPAELRQVDRPVSRRVWAADDVTGTTASSRHQGVPVVGRTPAGRR